MRNEKGEEGLVPADSLEKIDAQPAPKDVEPKAEGGSVDRVAEHMKQHPQVPVDNPQSALNGGGMYGTCGICKEEIQ